MKKLITLVVVALTFIVAPTVNAQEFKVDKSPMDQTAFPTGYREAQKDIKVTYSRPQLKGRSLSKLAPNGEVWRTGANEAVEVTLYKDMKLGTTPVKAGTYTLYTIPGDKEWTVILNKDLNVWGSYFYKEENDMARIKLPVETAKDSLEYFGMEFTKVDKGTHLHVGWGTMRLQIPFYN